MGDYLQKGTTYVDGGIVNASNLNAHIDDSIIKPTAISNRTDVGVPGGAVEIFCQESGTLKKLTVANLDTAIGGGGSADIHGQTAVTSISDNDELIIWEDSAAANRKITYGDLLDEVQSDLDVPTILSTTHTHDPTSIAALATRDITVTVTGASNANNPAVLVTTTYDLNNAGIMLAQARVTGANTVQFTYYNFTGGSVNLPSHTNRVVVFMF